MTTLCFLSNMTSAEIAAWVQAVGAIFAIIGAAAIAIYQSKSQHRSALELHRIELRTASVIFRRNGATRFSA